MNDFNQCIIGVKDKIAQLQRISNMIPSHPLLKKAVDDVIFAYDSLIRAITKEISHDTTDDT